MQFSIIIPALNRHAELRGAIRSCIEQSFGDFELLVIDDGSEPPLAAICGEFGDSRVRYFRNAHNIGVAASRNLGLDAALGDYVSFLDSDDVYKPTRLESLNSWIIRERAAPQIIFHRQIRLLSPAGPKLISPARLPYVGERLDEYVLLGANFIQTNTFVVDRVLAKKIRFDAQCKVHEDTRFVIDCWLEAQGFDAHEETLSEYRDFFDGSRLSRRLDLAALKGLLDFAEKRCSAKAQIGLTAYACGETSLVGAPSWVFRTLFKAALAGVPIRRCLVYLARSAFGARIIDSMIFKSRQLIWSRSSEAKLGGGSSGSAWSGTG